MRTFGIDPGITGYMAMIWDDGDDTHTCLRKCPTMKTGAKGKKETDPLALLNLVQYELQGRPRKARQREEWFGIIEKITSHAAGGFVHSAFALGGNYWIWRTALAYFGVSHDVITPQKWQKIVGIPVNSDKDRHIELANRLYPHAGVGRNHNKADALLMAHAARRIHGKRS